MKRRILQSVRYLLDYLPQFFAIIYTFRFVNSFFGADDLFLLNWLFGLFIVYPISLIILKILAFPIKLILDIIISYTEISEDNPGGWQEYTYYYNSDNYYNREEEKYQNNFNEQKYSYTGYQNSTSSEYQNAMNLFGFSGRFTEAELRERRRKLIRKVHPDAGGNPEDAARINAAYDVLQPYAVG